MDNLRVKLRIKGRVQGVFFRESARREALRLRLTGWVRNLDGGDVEAVAEGPNEAVSQWISWCRRGPPSARVIEVQVVEEAGGLGDFTTFSVEP